MSLWKQNFEAQQASQRIQEALGLLDTTSFESLTPEVLANFARLQKVLRILRAKIDSIDPELFHANAWANIGPWLSNVLTYVGDFVKTMNVSQLQNANSTVDEILTALKPVDGIPQGELSKAIGDAAAAFERRLVDELEATKKKAQQAQAQVSTLVGTTQTAAAELELLRQTIEQQKARLDQAIADFQKQFSTAEASRTTEFSATAVRFQSEFSGLTKLQGEEWAAAVAAKEKEWKDLLEQTGTQLENQSKYFSGRRAEVDEIFGAIGSASLSGHFALTADADSRAANWLRTTALGLMCLMVAVAGFSFYQSLMHPEIDWKLFLFRLATVLVIAIPALYAAQESNKHRQHERHNRKMQVELASIDAYLVKLPPDQQVDLKAKLTEKFFGQPEFADRDEQITKHQLLELVSDALKGLTKSK